MRHGLGILMFIAIVPLTGCSDAQTPAHKPPVAGLVHAEIAQVGRPVWLDGSSSAVAGGHLVRFRLAVADGSPAVELANPATSHVFSVPGSYGLELIALDDHGAQGSVRSTIRIVDSFAAQCDSSAACAGLPCLDGACAILACGGDPACPSGLAGDAKFCAGGVCSRTPAEGSAGDAFAGEDLGRLPLDGH
jgi:hypothetical protein